LRWVDDVGSDTPAPVAGTKRELLVWIWYPAATGAPGAVVDDYLPAQLRAPARPAGGSLISRVLSRVFGLLTRDLSKVHGHSIREPDVSPQQRSYPVVILRAGASAPVMNYSIYDRLPADGRVRIAIRGANHFTFSDDGALLKSHVMRGVLRVLGKLGIDGRRQLAVTAYCVHSFFRRAP